MKRKALSLILAGILVLGLSACSSGASSGGAATPAASTPASQPASSNPANVSTPMEAKHLVIINGFQETHCWTPFFHSILDLITEASDGAYTYDYFPGGELVTMGGEVDALRAGTADISLSNNAFADTRFPYTQVTLLPANYLTEEIATLAMIDLFESDVDVGDGKTFVELDYYDNGFIPFETPMCDPIKLALVKGVPLEKASDLQPSLTLRSPSRIANILCENLNVTGLTVASSEIYDVMSRGACNGILLCADWKQTGIIDLIGSVYNMSFGTYATTMVIPLELWNSFPEAFQEEFKAGYKKLVMDNPWTETAKENYSILDTQGSKVYEYEDLDPELQAVFDKACVDTWYDWIATMESEQKTAAKNVALLWRDLAVSHGAEFPEEIMNLK